MTTLLNNKPQIGVLAGFFSWFLYFLKTLFTNDEVLKWVAGVGIWLGVLVAALTAWLRIKEINKPER